MLLVGGGNLLLANALRSHRTLKGTNLFDELVAILGIAWQNKDKQLQVFFFRDVMDDA